MKQDCTVSQSTADETKRFLTIDNNEFPEGTHVSEPDNTTGSEIKMCSQVNRKAKAADVKDNCTSWSYLFVHNQKVKSIEEQLIKDEKTHFVHRTIKYIHRHRNGNGMRKVEAPSVSGLIFLQGDPETLQYYLDENVKPYRLCKNCSTGKVATIPCNQMEPFMRVAETDPERLRFLLRPFVYYSKNRTLLRILTGEYAGLEGYVIRIARDRRLVIDVGGMAVAISGVHAERFEEVNKNEANKKERELFYKRNLHERNAFIDRYFHQVKTAQEVSAQVENIEILRLQTLADVRDKKLDLKDAFATFYFMIEEIGYYYAPFIDYFKDELRPIFEAGRTVMQEIENIIAMFQNINMQLHNRYATEYEELQAHYGYLFEC